MHWFEGYVNSTSIENDRWCSIVGLRWHGFTRPRIFGGTVDEHRYKVEHWWLDMFSAKCGEWVVLISTGSVMVTIYRDREIGESVELGESAKVYDRTTNLTGYDLRQWWNSFKLPDMQSIIVIMVSLGNSYMWRLIYELFTFTYTRKSYKGDNTSMLSDTVTLWSMCDGIQRILRKVWEHKTRA
jgi:hypothetical protein